LYRYLTCSLHRHTLLCPCPSLARCIAATARSFRTTGRRDVLAVICCTETRALKNHSGSAGDLMLNFASTRRTLCKWLVFHSLKFFKRIATVSALVFICRHYRDLVFLSFRLKRLLHLKWGNFDLPRSRHFAPILRLGYLCYLLPDTQGF
jgi:hypothetical protein